MIKRLVLLCCISFAAFLSCGKNDDDTPEKGKIVTGVRYSSDDGYFEGLSGMLFSLDGQGRVTGTTLIPLAGESIDGCSYTYGSNMLTVNRQMGPVRGVIDYTISNGRVSSDESGCEKWEYNADGTLSRYISDYAGTEFEGAFYSVEATFQWNNGNLSQCEIREYNDDSENITKVEYEYGSDVSGFANIDANSLMMENEVFYLPYTSLDVINLTGSRSVNLIRSAKITRQNGYTYTLDFSYEFNTDGRMKAIVNNGSETFTYLFEVQLEPVEE